MSYNDVQQFLAEAKELYLDAYDPNDNKTKLYPKLSYGYNYVSIVLTKDDMEYFNDAKSLKELVDNDLVEDRVFDEIIYFIETGKYSKNIPREIQEKFINSDISHCLIINSDIIGPEEESYNLYLITAWAHILPKRIRSMRDFDKIDPNYAIMTSKTRNFIEECVKHKLSQYSINYDSIIKDEKSKKIVNYWREIIEDTGNEENLKILQNYEGVEKIEDGSGITVTLSTNFDNFLERFRLQIRAIIIFREDNEILRLVIFQGKPRGEVSLVVINLLE